MLLCTPRSACGIAREMVLKIIASEHSSELTDFLLSQCKHICAWMNRSSSNCLCTLPSFEKKKKQGAEIYHSSVADFVKRKLVYKKSKHHTLNTLNISRELWKQQATGDVCFEAVNFFPRIPKQFETTVKTY
jgi:hypothetical protein